MAGDFGSGPSLTVFSVAIINWALGDGVDPLVLLDDEVVRERQTAFDIARDVNFVLSDYYGTRAIFGDPSSKNVDSAQESWETNLRSGGLNYTALPAWYNDAFATLETLKDAQRLLDKGLLRVHERCLYIHDALESWEWDVPKGISIDLLSRETLKPKKNSFSHAGDSAFRYNIGFILRGLRPGMIASRSLSGVQEPPPEVTNGQGNPERESYYKVPGAKRGLSMASQIAADFAKISGGGRLLRFPKGRVP